jgi:hypothetical protein
MYRYEISTAYAGTQGRYVCYFTTFQHLLRRGDRYVALPLFNIYVSYNQGRIQDLKLGGRT